MCYHTISRRSATNRLGIRSSLKKIGGRYGPVPFGCGVADCLKHAIPYLCYSIKLCRCPSSRIGIGRDHEILVRDIAVVAMEQ